MTGSTLQISRRERAADPPKGEDRAADQQPRAPQTPPQQSWGMEKNLFGFIFKYSMRQQIILTVLSIASFVPYYY